MPGKKSSPIKAIIGVVVVVVVLFSFAACLDSCNRHKDTKPCFASSSSR